MRSPPATVEERLAALKARLLEMAREMRGRTYVPDDQVPLPPAGSAPPPAPWQDQEREPGEDEIP